MNRQLPIVLPLAIMLVVVGFVIPYALLAGVALGALWFVWLGLSLFVSEDDAFGIISAGIIVMAVMAFVLF